MRQSQLFTKTRKEAPKDEVSKNAELLIRGGFVDKLQAGVYTFLPLGFRVFKKIEAIIRDEMEKMGGQEILMPSLQPKENWEKTGRWDPKVLDDLYKVTDSSGRENALAGTHEEVVTPLLNQFISSYRDLPAYVFQIQNKFRMELRAKSGILRGREFMMKDFYSFHRDEADMDAYYERMKEAYKNVYDRVGIGDATYLTFASGGTFSKFSHEFQTVTDAGEDTIYISDEKGIAINKEVYTDEVLAELGLKKENLREAKAIEVGNIFPLKTKYSAAFDLTYTDESGTDQPVMMGCYGIGLSRLLGAVVEVSSDEKGIVWPESIAPFQIHLIALRAKEEADTLYKKLTGQGIEVLYDDREEVSAGEKFADADLLGIPHRVVISEKTLKENKLELKNRKSGEVKMVGEGEIFELSKK